MKELLEKIKSMILLSRTKRELMEKFDKLVEENKELLKENGIEL